MARDSSTLASVETIPWHAPTEVSERGPWPQASCSGGAMIRYLFAVDPSLTCSGWALFGFEEQALLAVGKIRSLPPRRYRMNQRLDDVHAKVKGVLDHHLLGSSDMLLCEAQTTMRDPRAAFAVEQVRGIFETCARERGVKVPGRVNPRSVHSEIIGFRGPQQERSVVKDAAQRIASSLYADALRRIGFDEVDDRLKRHQDIVDALLIGHFALGRLQQASRTRQPVEELFSQNEPFQRSRRWR